MADFGSRGSVIGRLGALQIVWERDRFFNGLWSVIAFTNVCFLCYHGSVLMQHRGIWSCGEIQE